MPRDQKALAADLHRRCQEREQREIGRLNQVLELAGHDGCLVSRLGEHFGETRDGPCGHCSWCLGGHKPAKLLARSPGTIDESKWRQAEAVRRSRPEALTDPRAFARFLCGLTSPRLTRHKLSREPLFGALDTVPFPQLLARAAAK
jgi:ATP-dependent DNA helicase RecQ